MAVASREGSMIYKAYQCSRGRTEYKSDLLANQYASLSKPFIELVIINFKSREKYLVLLL